jgi:prepilin-type N-terminal cleavage/methylation domain-containing protein
MIKPKRSKSQNGTSLIEVLIAIAVFGIIGVAFPYGLSTVLKADRIADVQSEAMSLAQSQIESVKGQPYLDAPTDGEASYAAMTSGGYTISSLNHSSTIINNTIYGVPWSALLGNVTGTDEGLQKVTVIIKQGSSEIMRLSTFKAK